MAGTSNRESKSKAKSFYIDFLSDIFGIEKPLAKLITISSGYYLYDTGTNKILGFRKEVYDLIRGLFSKDAHDAAEEFISLYGEEEFLKAAEDIHTAITTENILLAKKASNFGLSDHFKDFKEVLRSSLMGLVLEVTQKCPNRCAYCVYQDHYKEKRNFSQDSMSLETARKAVEFLHRHSSLSSPVFLGFYGGEPILKFPLIKKCVAYAKKLLAGKELIFNITTNAILITPEIAEYLFTEDFSILVSLDGPKEIHDRYRKDKEGKGTFDRTLNGLRILAEKYREIKKGAISVNIVYNPPFSSEKIDLIHHFLKELHWLPGVNVLANYPSRHSIPQGMVTEKDLEEDKTIMQWALVKYRQDFVNSDAMVKGQVERKLATILQRTVLSEPCDNYTFNGCCLPGQRKAYVSTDGSISICEKISSFVPVIGNVYTGFDFETIKNVYIDDYAEKSLKYCSGCWGIRMCDICYIHAYGEKGQLDMERKNRYCRSSLISLEKSLMNFVTLMEECPGKLDYLYKYEIT